MYKILFFFFFFTEILSDLLYSKEHGSNSLVYNYILKSNIVHYTLYVLVCSSWVFVFLFICLPDLDDLCMCFISHYLLYSHCICHSIMELYLVLSYKWDGSVLVILPFCFTPCLVFKAQMFYLWYDLMKSVVCFYIRIISV